jgi:DNA-binding NtrC family response regulator
MRELVATALKAVDHSVNLVIVGESGSGKDYLAEAIHASGPRSHRPFVRIDCASIPPELFESELFGYEKGAFTDARERKAGKLEMAQGGTVYFDEIAALNGSEQAKLLRTIQEKEFSRLGAQRSHRLDVRIIASSSNPLTRLGGGETLRHDLFFRLNVLTLEVPPLRARLEDLPLLARQFLRQAATPGRPPLTLNPAVLPTLRRHAWPGNLRELRNMLERASILTTTPEIGLDALPVDQLVPPQSLLAAAVEEKWTLERLERDYIELTIRSVGGNYSKASTLLGINRKTLLEKRRKFGIE